MSLTHSKRSLLYVEIFFPYKSLLHRHGGVSYKNEVCCARSSPRVVLNMHHCFSPIVVGMRLGIRRTILNDLYFLCERATCLQSLSQFLSQNSSSLYDKRSRAHFWEEGKPAHIAKTGQLWLDEHSSVVGLGEVGWSHGHQYVHILPL